MHAVVGKKAHPLSILRFYTSGHVKNILVFNQVLKVFKSNPSFTKTHNRFCHVVLYYTETKPKLENCVDKTNDQSLFNELASIERYIFKEVLDPKGF